MSFGLCPWALELRCPVLCWLYVLLRGDVCLELSLGLGSLVSCWWGAKARADLGTAFLMGSIQHHLPSQSPGRELGEPLAVEQAGLFFMSCVCCFPMPLVWFHLLGEALTLALGSDGDWDKQHQAELRLPFPVAQGEKLGMSKDTGMGAALVSPPGSKAFVRA